MSLLRARDAILRRPAVQTSVLMLSVVAALVVGLLAMHTFTSSMGTHEEPASLTTSATVGMAAMGTGFTRTDCSVTCDPGHDMAGMMCVLALLFTALSLMAASAASVTALGPLARQALVRMIAFAAVRANPPPDLNALSISRT
ncbi:MAG: hypothetical protein JWM49_1124 [Microbacteriaceae bacterium]|nr:hypothetical protein [Microbacteriaceae bacterium]